MRYFDQYMNKMTESFIQTNKSQSNIHQDLYFSDQEDQDNIQQNSQQHQRNQHSRGEKEERTVSPEATKGRTKANTNQIQKHHGKNQIMSTKQDYSQSKLMESSTQQIQNFYSNHQDPKICNLCGKAYGSNTALKFHIKNKHSDYTNDIPQPEKIFSCQLCGRGYSSKSALGLHMSNKHSSYQRQKILIEQLPYQQQRIQKCGCGRTYESRSALKMHIKKKHKGVILKGTTEKGPRRSYSHTVLDKLRNIQIQNHFRTQRSSSEDNSNSIYYSEDQQEQSRQKPKSIQTTKPMPLSSQPKYQPPIMPAKFTNSPHALCTVPPAPVVPSKPAKVQMLPMPMKQVEGDPLKPFRCGCGRHYSCSSSLNLHIKKNHNWIVPVGTIGGPRGIRCQDKTVNQQLYYPVSELQIFCSQCKELSNDSYFKCLTCPNHHMCPICFWGSGTANLGKEHDWILKDKH